MLCKPVQTFQSHAYAFNIYMVQCILTDLFRPKMIVLEPMCSPTMLYGKCAFTFFWKKLPPHGIPE